MIELLHEKERFDRKLKIEIRDLERIKTCKKLMASLTSLEKPRTQTLCYREDTKEFHSVEGIFVDPGDRKNGIRLGEWNLE